MSQERILLVDDSLQIHDLVKVALKDDVEIDCCATLREGLNFLNSKSYDLVIIDIELPDGNGLEICRYVRESEELQDIPVIVLSSKSSIINKELGFSLGADDFVSKPFERREFVARVQSKLKRFRKMRGGTLLKAGPLKMDAGAHLAEIEAESESFRLELTSLEFRLLYFMASREGRILSRTEILNGVWGEGIAVTDRTIDTKVSEIRKKLKNWGPMIRSVYGQGYSFNSAQVSN